MNSTESPSESEQNSTRLKIRTTCIELEKAIASFEDESLINVRAEEERKKIAAIREQLVMIRQQLETLA